MMSFTIKGISQILSRDDGLIPHQGGKTEGGGPAPIERGLPGILKMIGKEAIVGGGEL